MKKLLAFLMFLGALFFGWRHVRNDKKLSKELDTLDDAKVSNVEQANRLQKKVAKRSKTVADTKTKAEDSIKKLRENGNANLADIAARINARRVQR